MDRLHPNPPRETEQHCGAYRATACHHGWSVMGRSRPSRALLAGELVWRLLRNTGSLL